MKDRKRTEEAIINALDTIVRKRGYRHIGINAIAKEAGVSKVLIYRYFTDLDGLLSAWALKNNYWTGNIHPGESGQSSHEGGLDILQEQAAVLFSNPVLREIEKWLLVEKTDTGKRVMDNLESTGKALCRSFLDGMQLKDSVDSETIVTLLTAGITYLALKSDVAETYNGLPLRRISGLERINNAIETIISSLIEEKKEHDI